jgi:hypothetical protein
MEARAGEMIDNDSVWYCIAIPTLQLGAALLLISELGPRCELLYLTSLVEITTDNVDQRIQAVERILQHSVSPSPHLLI